MAEAGLATRYLLSAVEFDVVWDVLGLGPTPVVLQLSSPGRTHRERRRVVAATWARLREGGLVRPSGLEPALDLLLRLLAAPSERLELRSWGPTRVRAVAATRLDDGVLAQRRGDDVVIEPCRSPPAAVVALLPPAPPGPGRAASAPTSVLATALDRPSAAGLRGHLVDRGVPSDEAGPIARMLHGVHGRAQLGALTTDRWGTLRRRDEVLDVVDGPRGRYLMVRSDGWTTVGPIDARRLRHRAAELLVGEVSQSRSPCRMSCRPDSVIEPDREG